MNAKLAKEISTGAAKICMDNVYLIIKQAAEKGEEYVNYNLKDKESKFADYIISDLKQNGYEVKREKGSDQRDGDSWDYLGIDWS